MEQRRSILGMVTTYWRDGDLAQNLLIDVLGK
jgi:hypothetical protein